MKFMILGHACLYVEHQDTRLLIDPWQGSLLEKLVELS